MSVTINANGLSIVHKGSGGEANATLPDVCLTTQGKSVNPVPYGNNAKSADLVNGSTTVFADGGHSIAIKGCQFSISTGDAGGDKKGVSSGTIEGAAEFISASPNVFIEGVGVCRLSDQMTMNNGNTMCLGGVQNLSVTVTEEDEGTYTVYVKARYPDGILLKEADFEITDVDGNALATGRFDSTGESRVSGLKPGQIKIAVQESERDFVAKDTREENPHFADYLNDRDFFERAANGKHPFWQPQRIAMPVEGWGIMSSTLAADPYFADIVKLEVLTHFQKKHHSVHFDALAEAIIVGMSNVSSQSMLPVVSLALPLIAAEGEILSVLLRLPQHESVDRMLAYMRANGKGNPQTYLTQYNWQATQTTILRHLDELMNKIKGRIEALSVDASRLNYRYLVNDIFEPHIKSIDLYIKKLAENLPSVYAQMSNKAQQLLSDVSQVSVIQAPDFIYTSQSGSISAVINAIFHLDLEEQKWVKIRAVYDDLWETPTYTDNLKLIVNDVVTHKDKLSLTQLPQRSTISETIALATETQTLEGGVLVVSDLKPNADSVTIEFLGDAAIESKIEKRRDSIDAYLDGLLNTLAQDMSGFQQQWDEEGIFCLGDGVSAGLSRWSADMVELFTPDVWAEMGQTLASATTDTFDKLYLYANDKYAQLEKYTLETVTSSATEFDKTSLPSWVKQTITHSNVTSVLASIDAAHAHQSMDDAMNEVKRWWHEETDDITRKLQCIARHRQTIWALPQRLAENDINAVEQFIDTVLMEYDPEWAQEIKHSTFLPKALVLLNDDKSALSYFIYLDLLLEAIPPNFYTYHVGNAAAYIAIEIVMTIVLGLFTGPTAVTARIATLTAKLTAGANRAKRLPHAAQALTTFTDTLSGLVELLPEYGLLADDLLRRRKTPLINQTTNHTITVKQTHPPRKGACRFCHSTEHKTPRLYRGEINYV